MIYNKLDVGLELKKKVLEKQEISTIGEWAYNLFLNQSSYLDDNLRSFLLELSMMELGPEFEFTYEELERIADDLISGKEVHLKD